MQTRREFLKKSCGACLGASVLLTQLSGCTPLPIYKTSLSKDLIQVPLTSFLDSSLLIVRDIQQPYDILIVKKSTYDFNAILMKCSHRENPVTATTSGLYCSTHGSSFDLDGQVLKEPAPTSLKKYKTEISTEFLIINTKS
jgi:cytochrome b6-f complex iron-sulfur subunit